MIPFLRILLGALMAFIALALLHFTETKSFDSFSIDVAAFSNLLLLFVITSFVTPFFDKIDFSREPREQGTVKWFNVSKGYGFVTRSNDEDIFVHFRSIRGKGRRILYEGQTVEFTLAEGDKGPQAEDVEPLSKEKDS